jgi:hypothetical protein
MRKKHTAFVAVLVIGTVLVVMSAADAGSHGSASPGCRKARWPMKTPADLAVGSVNFNLTTGLTGVGFFDLFHENRKGSPETGIELHRPLLFRHLLKQCAPPKTSASASADALKRDSPPGQAQRSASRPPAVVKRYAPLVVFHPRERYWPMDPAYFVEHSALRFAHGKKCRDVTVAPVAGIDGQELGSGGYRHRAKSPFRLCHYVGREYASNERTRPHDNAGVLPRSQRAQGFALDLDGERDASDVRAGIPPAGNSYPNAPAIYFNYQPASELRSGYVRYWLFFGYNSPDQRVARVVDRHEGDWEGVAVRFDAKGRATEVAYYQHNCRPEIYSWPQMAQNGYLANHSHPVDLAANGSHASYPQAPASGTVTYACPAEHRTPV